MAKKKPTPNIPTSTVKAPKPRPQKPKALEVNSPSVSSEENGTVATSRMKGSYLTFDPRMDEGKLITVSFHTKETPGPVFEDIVYPSPEPGAGKTEIPPHYMTAAMEYTLVMRYAGTVNGQAAASLDKEVLMEFYPASEGKEFAPYFLDEKMFQNTPTLDMHDFKGDGIVKTKVPYLAQVGDKFYCTLVTQQFSGNPVFYTVAYGYPLTAEDIASGELTHAVSRGWLARQIPLYESMTLQCAYITSGLAPLPPADVTNPDERTLLPRNALQIQHRRTAAFIGEQGLDLPPAHLRQSAFFNEKWCLNPELTKQGGNVDTPVLETYADDQICFYVSGPGYGNKPLGCVTIANDGDLASIELSPCVIACFFNKSMTLTYTLAFNGYEQTSPAQNVSVSVPQFTHPTIAEATNGKVDLNTFTGPALATVLVWAYAECANLCWMWITGERDDGSAYRYDILLDEPVTDDWKAQGVEAVIPRAELQKLADCSEFKLHFATSFCEATGLGSAHEFPSQTFKIEQEPLVLLQPRMTEAVGRDLTVWNGRNGAHIEVDYVGISSKHTITVCWMQPDGSCLPLAAQPGSDAGPVRFFVVRDAVIEGSGKTVKINYTVTSACKVQTSADLLLNISTPVRLPTPVVLQATPPAQQGGILDLRTFSADARITVEKWWFILLNQLGWLECRGTDDATGAPSIIKVSTADPITSSDLSGGLDKILKRTDLEKLRNKTPLVVAYKATPDRAGVVGNAIEFPPLNLEFRKAFHDYTNFDPAGKGWNDWHKGPGATDPRDLALRDDPDGRRFLFDYGYSDNKDPSTQSEKLFKSYSALEVGRTYQFSVDVRRGSHADPAPIVALGVNGNNFYPPTVVLSTTWITIKGTFTATSPNARLTIDNRQMGIAGNDIDFSEIILQEL